MRRNTKATTLAVTASVLTLGLGAWIPLSDDTPDTSPTDPTSTGPTSTGSGVVELVSGRTYLLDRGPEAAGGSARTALVVALHGLGGDARGFAAGSRLDEIRDRGVTVVFAYGEGLHNSWNAGSCCGWARDHDAHDVDYQVAVVQVVRRRIPSIDPEHVYVVGFSNGDMLALRALCARGGQFRRIRGIGPLRTGGGPALRLGTSLFGRELHRPAQNVLGPSRHGGSQAGASLLGDPSQAPRPSRSSGEPSLGIGDDDRTTLPALRMMPGEVTGTEVGCRPGSYTVPVRITAQLGVADGPPPGRRPRHACGRADGRRVRDQGRGEPWDKPGSDLPTPPPVIVQAGDTTLELPPWSTCWAHKGCLDGVPPADLEDLGAVDGPVTVTFPRDGWTFDASQLDVRQAHKYRSGPCPREYIDARVVPTGDRSWTIHPRGPADRYRVEVSGRGPEGDVPVTFVMTTTADHSWPPPEASTAISWNSTGPGEFALLLHLYRLPAPQAARARVTLISGDSREPIQLKRRNVGCNSPHDLDFSASPADDPIIRRLGFPPYRIEFDVDIDGRHHVAKAGWPPYPETNEDDSGVTKLNFSPALPAR